MTDFSKELNKEQCEAATAADGPMLVLAAAGTGKTRTLVHRVAYLVEHGVPPWRILLLTFTNRAAREMLERAAQVTPGVTGIWGGTFHSICARLLRRYGSFLGYRSDFAILDEDDQKKLMTQCVKDLVKHPKDFPKPAVLLHLLSDAANREKDLETVVRVQQTKVALDLEETMKVLNAYIGRKKELGAMDFDDLLVNGLELLRRCDGVRAELQERFMHVLVDEYQDTNILQAKFTDFLAAKWRNIMVVGDDFQCIYTWRGAHFENIMQFPDRWEGCRVVKLERNYRSLSPILDVANVVMKDVPHSFEKTLCPFRQSSISPLPRLFRVWDGHAQADALVRIVSALRADGVAYRDMAVLYRSHYASIDIQMALTRAHVPFRITSGVGVFEQLHVKDVLAFLRLCLEPRAELSFRRLLELLPGVGEASAAKCWERLGRSFDGSSAMDRMNLETCLPSRARAAWGSVAKAFEAAPAHLAAGEDRLLMDDFVRLFYGDHLRRQFEEEEAESRLDDLGEITAQIAASPDGLKGFLEEVALMTNLDVRARADMPSDHMHLTTVHQAKGMEWPVVILPWLVDGIFPSSRSVDDGNIDEERRLFYVAVTRAKDRLYMLVPKSRRTPEGGCYPVESSVFVREIPEDLYDERVVRVDPSQFWECGYGGRGRGGGGTYGGGGRGGTAYKTSWRR